MSQNLIFQSILDIFSVKLLAAGLDQLLEASGSFNDRANIKVNLSKLIQQILKEEELAELWSKTGALMETNSTKFRFESEMLEITNLFLSMMREDHTANNLEVFNQIFQFLDRNITAKDSQAWISLLKETVQTFKDPRYLLEESFVQAVTRLGDLDILVKCSQRILPVAATDLDSTVQILARLFSKDLIQKETFSEKVSELPPLIEANQSPFFEALLDHSIKDQTDLTLCYLVKDLIPELIKNPEQLIEKLTLFKDSRRDCVNSDDEYFGVDGPSYQFVTCLLKEVDNIDDNQLYLLMSRCLLAVEKSFDNTDLQARSLLNFSKQLQHVQKRLASDTEPLLLNSVKISSRLLDARSRANIQLTLLSICHQDDKIQSEAVSDLLVKTMNSLRASRSSELVIEFIDCCTKLMKMRDHLLKHLHDLNKFFWEAKEQCPISHIIRYNEAWTTWSESVPTSTLPDVEPEEPPEELPNEPAMEEPEPVLEEPIPSPQLSSALLNLSLDEGEF